MADPNDPNKRKPLKLQFDTTDLYDFEFTNSLPEKFAEKYRRNVIPQIPELTITAGSSKITKPPNVPERLKAGKICALGSQSNNCNNAYPLANDTSVNEIGNEQKLDPNYTDDLQRLRNELQSFQTELNNLETTYVQEVDSLELLSYPEPKIPPPPPRNQPTVVNNQKSGASGIVSLKSNVFKVKGANNLEHNSKNDTSIGLPQVKPRQKINPNLTKEIVLKSDIESKHDMKMNLAPERVICHRCPRDNVHPHRNELNYLDSASSCNTSMIPMSEALTNSTLSRNPLSSEKNEQILSWMSAGKSISPSPKRSIPKELFEKNLLANPVNQSQEFSDNYIARESSQKSPSKSAREIPGKLNSQKSIRESQYKLISTKSILGFQENVITADFRSRRDIPEKLPFLASIDENPEKMNSGTTFQDFPEKLISTKNIQETPEKLIFSNVPNTSGNVLESSLRVSENALYNSQISKGPQSSNQKLPDNFTVAKSDSQSVTEPFEAQQSISNPESSKNICKNASSKFEFKHSDSRAEKINSLREDITEKLVAMISRHSPASHIQENTVLARGISENIISKLPKNISTNLISTIHKKISDKLSTGIAKDQSKSDSGIKGTDIADSFLQTLPELKPSETQLSQHKSDMLFLPIGLPVTNVDQQPDVVGIGRHLDTYLNRILSASLGNQSEESLRNKSITAPASLSNIIPNLSFDMDIKDVPNHDSVASLSASRFSIENMPSLKQGQNKQFPSEIASESRQFPKTIPSENTQFPQTVLGESLQLAQPFLSEVLHFAKPIISEISQLAQPTLTESLQNAQPIPSENLKIKSITSANIQSVQQIPSENLRYVQPISNENLQTANSVPSGHVQLARENPYYAQQITGVNPQYAQQVPSISQQYSQAISRENLQSGQQISSENLQYAQPILSKTLQLANNKSNLSETQFGQSIGNENQSASSILRQYSQAVTNAPSGNLQFSKPISTENMQFTNQTLSGNLQLAGLIPSENMQSVMKGISEAPRTSSENGHSGTSNLPIKHNMFEVTDGSSDVQNERCIIRKLPSGVTVNFRTLPQRSFASVSKLRKVPNGEIDSNQSIPESPVSGPVRILSRTSVESVGGSSIVEKDKSELVTPDASSVAFSRTSSIDEENRFKELISRFGSTAILNDVMVQYKSKGEANLVVQKSLLDIYPIEEGIEDEENSESSFSCVAQKGSMQSNPSLSDDSDATISMNTAMGPSTDSRMTQVPSGSSSATNSTKVRLRSKKSNATQAEISPSYQNFTHQMVDMLSKVQKKIDIMDNHLVKITKKQVSPKTKTIQTGTQGEQQEKTPKKQVTFKNTDKSTEDGGKIGGKAPAPAHKRNNSKSPTQKGLQSTQDLTTVPKGRKANLRRELVNPPARYHRNFIQENILRVSEVGRKSLVRFPGMRNETFPSNTKQRSIGLSDRQISEFLIHNFPSATTAVSEMVSKPLFANDREIRHAVRSELAALLEMPRVQNLPHGQEAHYSQAEHYFQSVHKGKQVHKHK